MSTALSFTRIALIGNDEDSRVVESLQSIATHLASRSCTLSVDAASRVSFGAIDVRRVREQDLTAQVDLLVAVGGDGTMLRAARLAAPHGVLLLGVNRGRLGFLADIASTDVRDRLDEILAGRFVRDRRAMLQATLRSVQGETSYTEALNDVVLQKWQTGRMLDFETWIDGRYVNTHGGDGMVIATATGSTAYALSCGGPILYPALDAVVLAPISPHTLSDRPIVVHRDACIELRLVERPGAQAQVTCDGLSLGRIAPGDVLSVSASTANVTLIHPQDHDYYRILRSKLRWGRGDRMRPEQETE